MRKILSHKQTLEQVGDPDRKTVHNWVKAGLFPEPVQTGPNKIGWYEDEVTEWQESRTRGFLRPVAKKADPPASRPADVSTLHQSNEKSVDARTPADFEPGRLTDGNQQ